MSTTFDRHVGDGALIVDTRPVAEFAAGHIPGSISNALRPVFASWLGWLADLDRPIVFVAGDDQDRDEIVRQASTSATRTSSANSTAASTRGVQRAAPITGIPLVDPSDAMSTVIDVRQHSEFTTGHVPGAINIELGRLADSVVPAGPVTVMCGHGERAMTAASILAARGHRDVTVLDGGPDTWAEPHRQPLVAGR